MARGQTSVGKRKKDAPDWLNPNQETGGVQQAVREEKPRRRRDDDDDDDEPQGKKGIRVSNITTRKPTVSKLILCLCTVWTNYFALDDDPPSALADSLLRCGQVCIIFSKRSQHDLLQS